MNTTAGMAGTGSNAEHAETAEIRAGTVTARIDGTRGCDRPGLPH